MVKTEGFLNYFQNIIAFGYVCRNERGSDDGNADDQRIHINRSHPVTCIKIKQLLLRVPTYSDNSERYILAIEKRKDPIRSWGRICCMQILEYLIKNANKNFHQAANKSSFQKKLIGLLKRLRGKSSFLKDLRSNSDNWNKI